MKKSPPFKPGMFALGFLGAYSVAALILFFTLRESLASGSGTTPRSAAGPEIISDNADLPLFETYPSTVAPENGRPVSVKDYQSPNPSGPLLEGGLSGTAASSIFPNGGPAPSPTNAPPSSFLPNPNSGVGGFPHLFGAGLLTAGFAGGSGTAGSADGSGTPAENSDFLPVDLSGPLIESIGPSFQNVKPLTDVPGGGPDGPKPPIDNGPPPGKPDPGPALTTVTLPEPLTISIFATGTLIVLRRGRKKAREIR